MTGGPNEEYTTELAEALESRDVPERAVARIVGEVESHVVESGEDPYDTFGPPARYADEFAPRSRGRELLVVAVLAGLLGFGGGFMVISGVFGLLDPAADLWGLAPWVRMTAGLLMLASFVALAAGYGVRSRRRAASWRL